MSLNNIENFVPARIVQQNLHELRNLNSKISGYIDAYLGIQDESDWNNAFDSADENIKKIYVGSRLTKFILDNFKFSIPNYIENIKMKHETYFSIHRSVSKIAKIYSNDFKKVKGVIQIEGNTLKKVKGEKEYFEIVLMLLIENSIKYSEDPSGKPPRISIKTEALRTRIQIYSFGKIIPSEDRPHLYEKEFRSTANTNSTDGLGMGLYNAQNLLKHFKAEIQYTVESAADSESGWNIFTINCHVTYN